MPTRALGDATRGLSPRVRGHPTPRVLLGKLKGSIPACAGASSTSSGSLSSGGVYPRVCGGILLVVTRASISPGLSPRVRGHQIIERVELKEKGSIPACAGASVLQFVRNRAPRAPRSVYRSERATFCRRDNHCFSTCRFERPNATALATRPRQSHLGPRPDGAPIRGGVFVLPRALSPVPLGQFR